MKNLVKRWNAPSPVFWKKVQRVGITAGSLGVLLMAPPFGLAVLGSYLITAGTVIGVLSQLTVEDSKDSKEEEAL
jgi:hypothetical protein